MNKNKKWWKKDGRKTCNKEKHKKKSKEIHLKKYGRVLEKMKDNKETKLTFEKSRKKEAPSMKKTAWFCHIVRVKGKTFSKEKSKTWEEFFTEMEGKSEKAGTDIFPE